MAEDPLEDPNKGEGDNKTIIGANTKITMDNLTPAMEAITIAIITVIIKAEVDVAMVVIITEVAAMDEVVIEAITISNTTNITHMIIVQVEKYGPPRALCGCFNHSPKHCFNGEHDISNLMEKMSLSSGNQHQNGLYQ